MRTIIAIALHKPAPLPADALYLPVQAGAAIDPPLPGMTGDDSGDHISSRNRLYSELTVHYWLWKNQAAQVYGLCHYRRYFTQAPWGRSPVRALTADQLDALMQGADVLLPIPRLYLIETNYTQYAHAHGAAGLQLARAVIADRHANYLPDFDRVMKRRWGRRFNMFIMRRDMFEAYSAWLFDILFEMERRMGGNIPERFFGYVAERLMDVWLAHARPRIRHLRVLHTESQHWPRKIASFLLRKITRGRKN